MKNSWIRPKRFVFWFILLTWRKCFTSQSEKYFHLCSCAEAIKGVYSMLRSTRLAMLQCVLTFLIIAACYLRPIVAMSAQYQVNNLDDNYIPLATYCTQALLDLCNLRSAWLACGEPPAQCEIILPNATYLWMDAAFGSLNLINGMNVSIQGSGSVVAPEGGNIQFINYTSIASTSTSTYLRIENIFLADFGSSTSYKGGALHAVGDLQLSILNTHFISNAARFGGAIYIANNSQPVSIVSSFFFNCTAASSGGALNVDNSVSAFTLHGSVFEQCYANDKGGAVVVNDDNALSMPEDGNTFQISDTVITSCFSNGGGGGAYLSNIANITLMNTHVHNSTSKSVGGGLVLTSVTQATLTDVTINDCSVNDNGGGLFLSNTAGVTIQSSVFYNNYAMNGGGIYVGTGNSALRLYNVSSNDNRVSNSGGGIFVDSYNTDMLLGGVSALSNHAAQYGGGMYLLSTIPNLVITDLEGALTSVQLRYTVPASFPADQGSVYYSEIVQNDLATGFVINFGESTELPVGLTLTIDCGSVSYDYTSVDALPGIAAPSLVFENNTIIVSLTGASCENCAGQAFQLFITPLIHNPVLLSAFENNTAGANGGGVYFYQDFAYSLILNTHINMNNAEFYGGGLYMFTDNNNMMLRSVVVANNTADAGGGMYLFGDINALVMDDVSILQNVATNGGGLFINFNVGGNVSNSLIAYNSAFNGGGMMLLTTQVTLTFHEVEFFLNSAAFGGGIILDNQNGAKVLEYPRTAIKFTFCLFSKNEAVYGDGGAVYFDTGNSVTFEYCNFVNNTAIGSDTGSGGAVFALYQNYLNFHYVLFEGNLAAYGGGAVNSGAKNNINMQACVLADNEAAIGGALFIQDYTQLTFLNQTTFEGNLATDAGGAIASLGNGMWMMGFNASVSVNNNVAGRGSALFFQYLNSRINITGFSFAENAATVGGTVFWLHDSYMKLEPAGLNSSTNTWHNNIAPYGKRAATQAIELLCPDQYSVQQYFTAISPAIVCTLSDYYGNYIPLTGSTSVVPTVNVNSAYQCTQGSPPSIAGSDATGVVFEDGRAVFNAIQLFCFPGGSFALTFTARLGDQMEIVPAVAAEQYYISQDTQIIFRTCKMGEKIQSLVCQECGNGTYSLESNVTKDTQCNLCGSKQGVESCWANVISLHAGYWRRYPTSNAIQVCPSELSGCKGGAATGTGLCQTGFTGPLCAVCADGYYIDGSECKSCTNDAQALSTGAIALITVLATVAGALCAYIFRRYYYLQSQISQPGAMDVSALPTNTVNNKRWQLSSIDKSLMWLSKHIKTITTKLKITVVTYQIVSAIPSVFSVTLPRRFTSLLRIFSFVNLDFVSLLPLQCSTNYTFIDELLISTLLPIGLALGMVISFLVHAMYVAVRLTEDPHRKFTAGRDKYDAIKDQYLNYFFYLTYLVLPSVSTLIFQTFLCTNIDPENENPSEDNLFLTADMSISCTSEYYYRGRSYAIFMIFVYPIGIPCMYMYLLYSSCAEIKSRVAENTDKETSPGNQSQVCSHTNVGTTDALNGVEHRESQRISDISNPMLASTIVPHIRSVSVNAGDKNQTYSMSAPAARLAFLWAAFKPQYWYWEVVETTRRLMLTAVLSITGAGTSQQAVLALLLAILYIKLYSYFSPYEEAQSSITAEVGQYQILFTFFGALITMDSLLDAKYNSTVDGMLILLNLGVMLAFGYYELTDLYDELAESREEEKKKIVTDGGIADQELTIEMVNIAATSKA